MADVDLTYSVGTVSVAADDTVVSFTGAILESVNVRQYDAICIDPGVSNILVPILSVDYSNSQITIPEWNGGAKVNVSYVIYQLSPLRYNGARSLADVDDMLSKLNTEGWYRYINPAYADPTAAGIVANEGQFAFKYTTGQLWIMSGGVWQFVGVFKGLSPKGTWNNATAYVTNDVVSYNGSSYIAVQNGTNHLPTDTAWWQILASKGDTGPVSLKPLVVWATATAYAPGPPADYVAINGSSYSCVIAHTSDLSFAIDLAAGRWVPVAVKGADAPVYGGTSTTSIVVGTGAKAFVTQSGLAYQSGARVRASSAANTSNWMEGIATYSNTNLTLNVDKFSGSGTYADWNFNISGAPGAGDMSSINYASEYIGHESDVFTNLKAYEQLVTPQLFGAIGNKANGSVDARAEIAATDNDCVTRGIGFAITKNHRISSDIEIKSPVIFYKGGKLTVDAGVKVALSGGVLSGEYQIFKYADRTSRVYCHNTSVKAAWWGVDLTYNGVTFVKKNNNIELQYALDSVAGSTFDRSYPFTWDGGTVEVGAGYCLMQAGVIIHGFTTLRGTSRGTIFQPDSDGWTGETDYMFKMYREFFGIAAISVASPAVITSNGHGQIAGNKVFFTTTGALPSGIVQNTEYYVISSGLTTNQFQISATSNGAAIATTGSQSGVHTWHQGVSQFNTRLENCRIRGNNFTGVTHQVLAWSPNEQCGCYNVHFDSIYKYGVTYQRGYGGSVVFELEQCELWLGSSCSNTAVCINIDMLNSMTLGWMQIVLDHVTVSGSVVPVSGNEWVGLRASGRVVVNTSSMFAAEYIVYGILLFDDACLTGNGIQGNVGSTFVIALNTDWNNHGYSYVDVFAKKGNTTTLLKDFSKNTTIFALDPPDGRILMPSNPTKAFAYIRIQGGIVRSQWGNITFAGKPSTGIYSFNLINSFPSGHTFSFLCQKLVSAPSIVGTYNLDSTNLQIIFHDLSGNPTDVAGFDLHLLPVPNVT